MAREIPWFKFSPEAWISGDIKHCSNDTRVFFLDLCCYLWKNKAIIKNDKKLVTRLTGDLELFNKCLEELVEWEIIDYDTVDMSITVKFITKLYNEATVKSKKASAAGKASAKSKKMNKLSAPTDVEQALNGRCVSVPTQAQPKVNHIEEEGEREEDIEKEIHTIYSFDEFYQDYNHKKGRKDAEKAYSKVKETDRVLIKKNVPLYVASTPDTKWRSHPATYINGEKWNDEITIPMINEEQGLSR